MSKYKVTRYFDVTGRKTECYWVTASSEEEAKEMVDNDIMWNFDEDFDIDRHLKSEKVELIENKDE